MFMPTPKDLLTVCGYSIDGPMLGNKEENETTYKFFKRMLSGETKNPTNETLSKHNRIMLDSFQSRSGIDMPSDYIDDFNSEIDSSETFWEFFFSKLNKGHSYVFSGDASPLLQSEALRLEKLDHRLGHEIAPDSNLEQVKLYGISFLEHAGLSSLKSVQSLKLELHRAKSNYEIELARIEITKIVTLYLLVCLEVDQRLDRGTHSFLRNICSISEDGKIERPMTRFLVRFKETEGIVTDRDFCKFIAPKFAPNSDPSSIQREYRKWKNNGDIPSFQRFKQLYKGLGFPESNNTIELVYYYMILKLVNWIFHDNAVLMNFHKISNILFFELDFIIEHAIKTKKY